ncbi:MAG: trypsin-like peptidase domain-containing protein [Methylocystis sp.]|uniref:trypsin-like peptidase domain-containing protein n=1 Tax=Methylocystis sp. TaxID=1911079 RepID=UPI003DA30E2B
MQKLSGGVSLSTKCSRIAQKIEMLRRQFDGSWLVCATATGSYWIYDEKWYLITNWHNLTGCDPEKETALSSSGAVPTHVRVRFLHNITVDGKSAFGWSTHELSLYEEDGKPLWFEHPVFGRKVDVAALAIFNYDPTDATVASLAVNKHDDWFDLRLNPGDDCFVLGYPGGYSGGFHFPLWKRASIASEPSIDLDSLPKLLVDTATRKGMSGAPVVAISNGWHVPKGKDINDAVFGRVEKFIGIYSGRTDADENLSIGTVWKEQVIEEIIRKKHTGFNPLQP